MHSGSGHASHKRLEQKSPEAACSMLCLAGCIIEMNLHSVLEAACHTALLE